MNLPPREVDNYWEIEKNQKNQSETEGELYCLCPGVDVKE